MVGFRLVATTHEFLRHLAVHHCREAKLLFDYELKRGAFTAPRSTLSQILRALHRVPLGEGLTSFEVTESV